MQWLLKPEEALAAAFNRQSTLCFSRPDESEPVQEPGVKNVISRSWQMSLSPKLKASAVSQPALQTNRPQGQPLQRPATSLCFR